MVQRGVIDRTDSRDILLRTKDARMAVCMCVCVCVCVCMRGRALIVNVLKYMNAFSTFQVDL